MHGLVGLGCGVCSFWVGAGAFIETSCFLEG